MPSVKDFFDLIVPQYIPMAIITLLLGVVVTTGVLPDWRFWPAALSLVLVVGAFNSFNAISDKEIDRINKPLRPIPSKLISDDEALWFAIGLYFVALVLAFLIGIQFFAIVFVSVIVTIFYSYPGIDLKRKFFIGTLSVVVFYAILCALAGWALYQSYPIPYGIIFFLFLLGFSLAIAKDFMDIAGDHFQGAKTFPVVWGIGQSVGLIFISLLFSFAFLVFLITQEILSTKYYLLLIALPFMLFNVNSLRGKQVFSNGNSIFNRTIILLMLFEVAIIIISLT